MDNQFRFIDLEGQDGTGKETQLILLKERLPDAKTISLPQYGQSSAYFVENYLSGEYGDPLEVYPYQAAAFYAMDRFDASVKVNQWLREGNMVIADRWTFSNVAYQAAKVFIKTNDWRKTEDFARGLLNFEHLILDIPKPLYVYLKVPSEISCDLKAKQQPTLDAHEASRDYQKIVTRLYEYFSKVGFCGRTKIIDCVNPKTKKMLSPQVIHKKIWEMLNV